MGRFERLFALTLRSTTDAIGNREFLRRRRIVGRGTPRDQAQDERETVSRIITHIPTLAFTKSRPD